MKVAGDVPNCELAFHGTTVVTVTAEGPPHPASKTYTVRVPYIENTTLIKKGEPLMVKATVLSKKEKAPRAICWADTVATHEKKRARMAPKIT